MSHIKLSICITTLNRSAFIGATLESIVSQATEEVEIVIVDGASTDNTAEVVHQYQKHFPQLRYFYQAANMGVDRDFDKAVELAQGEYCWLFADDDILKAGAVPAVLEAIRHPYGLVIVNAEVKNSELTEVLEPRRLRTSTSRVYHPSENERLFAEVADYMSFIGCVVIRRELWKAREKEKYFGTAFVHVGVVFQSPLSEDTLVIAEPWISIRYGNAMWTAKYFEVWMFKWPQLIWSFPHFSDSSKRQVCPKEPWRRVKSLLIHRAKGAFSLKEYSDWLEPRLKSRWARFTTKLVAQFPGSLVNFLVVIYCSVKHRASGANLVDLVNSRFYFRNHFKHLPWRNK